MFAIKRNQIIITALVVMIAVAGYLNYIDSRTITASSDSLEDMILTEEGEINALVLDETTGQQIEVITAGYTGLDEVTIATGDDTIFKPEDNGDISEAGAAVFVSSSSDSSYFVQAKLDREQSRARQKEVLLDLINNANVDKTQKAECADSMLQIQQQLEKETTAEALIEAKGFAEAFVKIDDQTVDVVVSKSVLSDAEIAQIEDIVTRKTGIALENIRIVPIKR